MNAGVKERYTKSHESIPFSRETSEPATRKLILKTLKQHIAIDMKRGAN